MRKMMIAALVSIGATVVSCSTPTQTIENLKTAITAEVNASARYTAYAERAVADSLPKIASMFAAFAQSEAIHAQNFMAELEKLGETFTPILDSIVADSNTLANLYSAKNGEEYEVLVMYPDFIEVATAEGVKSATKAFEWALKAEEKHGNSDINAIQGIESGAKELNLPFAWAACPTCGNSYVAGIEVMTCPLCGVSGDNFIVFDHVNYIKK